MLWEASVALMTLMFGMWAAAIWATYTHQEGRHSDSVTQEGGHRTAA